jgi:hypothetical protein
MAEVAGELKLLLSVDGTTWSSAIDRAQQELDKLKRKTSEAGKVTRAEMTEARHAIHLLGAEIGVELPRAVQGFIAKLPGVAEVMSHAFAATAVIGIGVALFEAGKKVVEFIEKTKRAAEEAKRATDKLIEGRHLATLELEASTAKIEEQIAKLEKKPGDGLKLGLAEARVEAEKLAQSLRGDVEQLHQLVETKMSAGWLMRAATGAAGSQGTLDQIDKYGEKLEEIARITDPAKRTEEMKEYTGATLNALHEEITARERLQQLGAKIAPGMTVNPLTGAETSEFEALKRRFGTGGDQTKVLQALKAFHDSVQMQYDFSAATEEHMTEQQKLDRLTAEKERQDLAKQAVEALKRETAERMAVYENDLAAQKAAHQMSLEEEREYWQKRLMTGTNLGDPINALISRKIAPLSQEIFKRDTEAAKEWVKMMQELQTQADRVSAMENPLVLDRAQAREESQTTAARMAALHDRPELLRQITAAQDELNASEAVSAGLMDRRTAEMINQRNVIARLTSELEELEGRRAAVAGMPANLYTPTMNPEAIENQIMAKQAEIAAAKQTLQYEAERDTFGGEMRAMFAEWIERATDLKHAMTSIFDESLNSINNAILRTMTDRYHRGEWKAAGRSIFTGIAGTGLTAAEGALMKGLGLGGKLGTRENPMWIRDAGTVAVGTKRAVESMFNTATGGTTAAGSWVGKMFGTLAHAIPFMASGGSLDAGMPAIVGERGPELFVPSGSGRIVPNNQLGGMTHIWNIDARGASDPAAVRFAVQRGIAEAAPRIAAGAIAASRDLDRRKPLMAR